MPTLSDHSIRIVDLGKKYHIGSVRPRYHTFRESLTSVVTAPARRIRNLARGIGTGAADLDQEFWALRGISMDVEKGEMLGVIGHNGAGKTTLLKVLARITKPTEGRAEIHGRVASLLEVGTGFHPELTGRENVFLNGSILGMRRDEIRRKFDEIVSFSGVEQFLDTPVKHYSSGMHVRLAFAVAAHLEPEILFIDEVLSVGDAAFQKRSLGKMEDVARGGRTILFVSHNMVAVQNLCTRVVWLENGRIRASGDAREVTARYLASARSERTERRWTSGDLPGSVSARLLALRVVPAAGSQPAGQFASDCGIDIEVDYERRMPGRRLHVTIQLMTQDGVLAMESASCEDDKWARQALEAGLVRATCTIPPKLLNSGVHSVSVLLVEEGSKVVARARDAISFEIQDVRERPYGWYGRYGGAVHPRLPWTSRVVQPSEVGGMSVAD